MHLSNLLSAALLFASPCLAAGGTSTTVSCSTSSSSKSLRNVKTSTVSTTTLAGGSVLVTASFGSPSAIHPKLIRSQQTRVTPTTTITANKPVTVTDTATSFATVTGSASGGNAATPTVSATLTYGFAVFENVTGTSTFSLVYSSTTYSSYSEVPTPSGWLPLTDTKNGYPGSNGKRDAEADAEPAVAPRSPFNPVAWFEKRAGTTSYPASVICTKSVLLPPTTQTVASTAKAVRITIPPTTVFKTITTVATTTINPSGSLDAGGYTFTTASWVTTTTTVTSAVYSISRVTSTSTVSAAGTAPIYDICSSKYMYGPNTADGNYVLSLYDPGAPSSAQLFYYPSFSAYDCCALCASNGACAAGAFYYGTDCFLLLTYNGTCNAQTDYHEQFVEGNANVDNVDDVIFNGPCGFATWDGQVLNGVGAMEKKRQLSPAVGREGAFGGPGTEGLAGVLGINP